MSDTSQPSPVSVPNQVQIEVALIGKFVTVRPFHPLAFVAASSRPVCHLNLRNNHLEHVHTRDVFTSNGLAPKGRGYSIDAEVDTGTDMLKMVNANKSADLPVSIEALGEPNRDKRLN